MDRCKVGILGCGNISSTYVADIQTFYKELQIVACANRSPEKAKALAAQFGIPKAYTPEELLQDPEVELVLLGENTHVETMEKYDIWVDDDASMVDTQGEWAYVEFYVWCNLAKLG
mgnify:CR=1 FL=1